VEGYVDTERLGTIKIITIGVPGCAAASMPETEERDVKYNWWYASGMSS
jgi:hypothetical protein